MALSLVRNSRGPEAQDAAANLITRNPIPMARDLLVGVVSSLDMQSAGACAATCKAFRRIVILAMQREVHKIQACGSLSGPFQQACHLPNGTQLDPSEFEQIPKCLAVFHAFLLEQIPHVNNRRAVIQHAPSFSATDFLVKWMGTRLIDVQMLRNLNLQRFSQHLNPPLPPMDADQFLLQPDFLHTTINTGNLLHIGSEIGKFPHVTTLTIEGGYDENEKLTILPREMAQLRNCTTLDLSRNSFTHVPEILADMPVLSEVNLENNPIRVLPDDATFRRVWNCWSQHARHEGISFLRALGIYDCGERQPPSPLVFWLNTETLTDMPFSLWFKEKFSIPYVRVGCITGLMKNLMSRLIRSDLNYPLFFLAMGSLILLQFVVLIIGALVNAPIFLFNLLGMSSIETLVSLIRNQLGYSRMVHMRDILEGPAPAPQDWVDPPEEQPAPMDDVDLVD
jgi:hypothetical protein